MSSKIKAAPVTTPPSPDEPAAPARVPVLLASGNDGKLKELEALCGDLGLPVAGPERWAQGRSPLPAVHEDGASFLANARKKALSAVRHARACGDADVSVIADDSGLCVVGLGGDPGVHSARFAGPNADPAANRARLIAALDQADAAARRAAFECVIVLAGPLAEAPGCAHTDDGIAWRAFNGRCEGSIGLAEVGKGGFGYDALFVSDELGKTFAEASDAEKHHVSHRGRAMRWLGLYLRLRGDPVVEGRPMYLRPLGLKTLEEALVRTAQNELRYADQALELALHHAPQLGGKERQAVAELHWHALRRLDRLTLAVMAMRGATRPRQAPDPRSLDAKAARVVALLTVADVDPNGKPRDPAKKGDVTALDGLAKRNPGQAASWPATPGQCTVALRHAAYAARELPDAERKAIDAGYPLAFMNALDQELGADHAALALEYLGQRAPLTLRANRSRTTALRLMAELHEEGIATLQVPGVDDGLWCVHSARVTQTRAFVEGRVEIQDEGSQRIVLAVGARPGETVIDWCAGAGGKTLALSAAMRGEGRLIALDPNADRLAECRRRCERAGARVDARVIDKGPKPLGDLADFADAVLVDSPCSSTGALRRSPELRWHLDADWLGRFPEQQLSILTKAAVHVKRGGRLVYATCSLLRRENEDVVSALLAARDDFDLVTEARIGPANRAWLESRPLPAYGPDGFYLCVMRRKPRVADKGSSPLRPPVRQPSGRNGGKS